MDEQTLCCVCKKEIAPMELRRLVYDKNYNQLYVHDENCYAVWANNLKKEIEMIDIKKVNILLAEGAILQPEQFKQLDGAVVHLELKWNGTMIMNGDATIWHITDDNTAFGEIVDEDDGNVFRGAISRHTIDKIISVPQQHDTEDGNFITIPIEEYDKLKLELTGIAKTARSYADCITKIQLIINKCLE